MILKGNPPDIFINAFQLEFISAHDQLLMTQQNVLFLMTIFCFPFIIIYEKKGGNYKGVILLFLAKTRL